jgi:hypothetical protein
VSLASGRNRSSLGDRADLAKDSRQIGQDFIVSKTNDLPTIRHQQFRARGILFNLFVVALAIHLNDKSTSWTSEINDKGTQRMLPPKRQAGQSVCPQGIPENLLGSRHPLA